MPKFFEHNGEIFIEVKPVKSLFNSSLIHDVITSGRKFVVNMNTGELTIFNPRPKEPAEKTSEVRGIRISYCQSDGRVLKRLSQNFALALKDLNDLTIEAPHGWLVFAVTRKDPRIVYFNDHNWLAFSSVVRALYHEHGLS